MSSSSESFIYDNLRGGSALPLVTDAGTLQLLQDLTRGAVLGRVLRALGDALADSGNTGEGTIDDVALGAKSKVGIYTITCVAAGPPAVFSVVDPDGNRLADAEAEVAYAGPIAFLIEAYGVAFAVGDVFTVEIEAGSGELVLADSDAVDGSEDIYAILAETTDASLEAKVCPIYLGGEFNETACTFAAGDDADTFRDQARDLGILFRTNIAA